MAKSILEIEVKEDQFKDFINRFNQYQERLKELPGDWGKFDEGTKTTAENFAEMTAALLTQREILRQQEKEWEKQEAIEKRLLDLERKRKNEVHAIWEDTKRIGSQVVSTTRDLFRWMGVGSAIAGLTGAGSLWGLDTLARGVSDARRTSMGLGTTTGRMQAFNVNYGQYFNAPGLLQSVAAAQSRLGSQWAFGSLGITNPQKRDPVELLLEMLPKVQQIWKSGPQTEEFASAKGLFEMGFDINTLKELGQMDKTELDMVRQKYEQDKKTYELNQQLQIQWQDLERQLVRSKQAIETALIKALGPITPELTELSDAITKAIETFLNPATFSKITDNLKVVIENLTKWIGSPKFLKDIQTFTTDIGEVASAVVGALKALHIIKETEDERIIRQNKTLLGWLNITQPFPWQKNSPEKQQAQAAIDAAQADMAGEGLAAGLGTAQGGDAYPAPPAATGGGGGVPGYSGGGGGGLPLRAMGPRDKAMAAKIMATYMSLGYTKAEAAAFTANLWEESNFRKGAIGDSGLAHGAMQLHPDRETGPGGFNEWAAGQGITTDFLHTSLLNQIRYQRYEATQGLRRYVGPKLDAVRNDPLAAADVVTRYDETPKDMASAIASRRALAQKLYIEIVIPAGANVNTQASQLP